MTALNKTLILRVLIVLTVFIISTHFTQARGDNLVLGTEFYPHTIYAGGEDDLNTRISNAITKEIINTLKGEAFSLFRSAIVNFIFGEEPDFATLSQESLEDIRLIVQEEVDTLLTHFSQSNARALLQALTYNLAHYNAKAIQNDFDQNLLTFIVTDSADLITDKAFSRDDFPSSFFFMADTYAISSALRLVGLTEDFLQDDLTDFSFIYDQAQQMHDTLQEMASRVSLYVDYNVRFVENEACLQGSLFCTWEIHDSFINSMQPFSSYAYSRRQVLQIYIDLKNQYKLGIMSQDARDTMLNLKTISELGEVTIEERICCIFPMNRFTSYHP